MIRETKLLRFLLALLLFAIVLGCGFLWPYSLESARTSPELAHLRLPTYFAVLVGFIPVVVAVKLAFDFLGVIDRSDPLSAHTVQILRRMKLLIGVFAGYLGLGFIGFWIAAGTMHAGLLVAWFIVQGAALVLFAKVASLEQIFALKLRAKTTS
jgi:hypothetical protein